jgi:hypothetical protein
MVPVPTFEKVLVPVPTFEKFRFRFQLHIYTIKGKFFFKKAVNVFAILGHQARIRDPDLDPQ